MMDKLIERFPDQIDEALQIVDQISLKQKGREISHIHVAGLGGSGIGADFAAGFITKECRLPFTVSKGYDLPASVGPHTLAIASSYSGNTEETVNSFYQMQKAGAHIVVVSSGGKLIELAKKFGLSYVKVPDNWPSPRACLGYSVILQMGVLMYYGFISDSFINAFKASSARLRAEKEEIQTKALSIAKFLVDKTPIIYTTDYFSALALRFKQQINENAKTLCWYHIIPEMNHNELVGWKDQRQDIAVLALRTKHGNPRNTLRFDINKEIISDLAGSWIELYSRGESQIEETMYLVHLTDWVSYYLAMERGVDAVEVNIIDFLKGQLANQ